MINKFMILKMIPRHFTLEWYAINGLKANPKKFQVNDLNFKIGNVEIDKKESID